MDRLLHIILTELNQDMVNHPRFSIHAKLSREAFLKVYASVVPSILSEYYDIFQLTLTMLFKISAVPHHMTVSAPNDVRTDLMYDIYPWTRLGQSFQLSSNLHSLFESH